jgi:hypothetical protein
MRTPASSAAAEAERQPGVCRRDVAGQHFVPDLQDGSCSAAEEQQAAAQPAQHGEAPCICLRDSCSA